MQCSEDCKTLATAVFKRLPSMRTRSSGLLSTSLTSRRTPTDKKSTPSGCTLRCAQRFDRMSQLVLPGELPEEQGLCRGHGMRGAHKPVHLALELVMQYTRPRVRSSKHPWTLAEHNLMASPFGKMPSESSSQ